MHPIEQLSGTQPGNIMIVDDNPANLKLLEDMLRQHGYEIRSFPRGRLALAAAANEPPDLILLDINMPEMNGYEVCKNLKADTRLAAIPVIFLSALNAAEDKVKGFEAGGVDYVCKPFQMEEVQARVESHLKLRRAQQVEHELLDRTLGGAVGLLWELVQLTSPMLALRSHAIRGIVHWITTQTGTRDAWQYELAATLCLLGCVAVPDQVFHKAYSGQDLSRDEDQMFRAHPVNTARLISNIPRLEVVAEMIRGQQSAEKTDSPSDLASHGAHMLHLALELDQRIYRGRSSSASLFELNASRRFDSRMLDALKNYSPEKADFEMRRLPIRELRPGMVLDQDLWSGDGNVLIFKAGTTLTATWIERLKNFTRTQRADELVNVRVPRLTGVHNLEEFGYGASRSRTE